MAAATVHEAWRTGRELLLLDAREEAEFAEGHPLFAASFSLGRIELDAYSRIPRRSVPIVCVDGGGGGGGADRRAERAAEILVRLGYTDVGLLEGSLDGWRAAGLELFGDVNSPSKAFGELVAEHCGPRFVEAAELAAKVHAGTDVIVVDARRFDEFTTMSIPGARNVPGGELVYRLAALAGPDTEIVVNCAGRTRSIIGAQSLVNVGYPNPVAALRNGTIGWTLAGLDLAHGATARFDGRVGPSALSDLGERALREQVAALGARAGVQPLDAAGLAALRARSDRTTYVFDVRQPDEYECGHLPGARLAPGGQLVQETDAFAPVRGATVVCCDDDGIRAAMAGSWLAQMGWEVAVVRFDGALATESGPEPPLWPPAPAVTRMTPDDLAAFAASGRRVRVLDVGSSRSYQAGHVPGAEFTLRGELPAVLGLLDPSIEVVVTSEDGRAAEFAAADLAEAGWAASVLDGGTGAWVAAQLPVEIDPRWTSAPIDRYRRPYEGTDVDPAAMAAYLEWEYGLVAQLERDGSHRFHVLT